MNQKEMADEAQKLKDKYDAMPGDAGVEAYVEWACKAIYFLLVCKLFGY
jgi:hypothetical protein